LQGIIQLGQRCPGVPYIEDKYKEKELNVNLALLFSLARDVVTVLEVRGPTSEGGGSANPMMRCSMARLRPE
jgi:hypothetical protein